MQAEQDYWEVEAKPKKKKNKEAKVVDDRDALPIMSFDDLLGDDAEQRDIP